MKSLVYYEILADRPSADRREREIKGWRRDRKLELVETQNPQWKDLSARWVESLERFFGR
jgi:putative endonuclease